MSQLIRSFPTGIAVICGLAMLGLIVFANEGALLVPACISKWAEFFGEQAAKKRAPLVVWWILCALSYLLIFAISGFMIMLCVALLASPMLIFRFALGWTWEDSALPGVISGIVLVILGLYFLTARHEKNKALREERNLRK